MGQTLILTTRDAHVANYIGPPYVYGIERVGTSCGLAANGACVVMWTKVRSGWVSIRSTLTQAAVL